MRRFWMFGILALVLADVMAVWVFAMGSEWVSSGEHQQAPAAIVFWADHDQMGPDTERSLQHALSQLQAEQYESLILVGGLRERSDFHGAKVMKDWLLARGVLEEQLYVGTGSNDSQSNLKVANRILDEQVHTDVGLVSSPLHVPRLAFLANDLLPGVLVHMDAWRVRDAMPRLTWPELWLRTHHEWVAWLSYALPQSWYDGFIAYRRG